MGDEEMVRILEDLNLKDHTDNFLKEKISPDTITALQQYIKVEEFDTDSIYLDIDFDSHEHSIGNIAQAINNDRVMTMIKKFIHNIQS